MNDYAQQAKMIPLRRKITCPHCWEQFSPEDTLWIAEHPDLLDDQRLGAHAAQRFLPTRFNLDGAAIDLRGFPCHRLACPSCHLQVPRPLFEVPAEFMSILGSPACGKSYFLAAMTWRLRSVFPVDFCLAFEDVDPALNQRLRQYEDLQFDNPDQDTLVSIEKTETEGPGYDTVSFGGQHVNYPRPILFSLKPTQQHPNVAGTSQLSRVLALYDNAGESFLPGADTATTPVTRHLALSEALFFLFDPTQEPRFREACRGLTDDPQMLAGTDRPTPDGLGHQELILVEAANRVRRYAGLSQNQKHNRPLIIVVTKFDCWASLLGIDRPDSPWILDPKRKISAMHLGKVNHLSAELRELLLTYRPEIVTVAENFAQEVVYIPVSAMGKSPEQDPETGALGMRPRDIQPIWVEVPLLYTLCRWKKGLVPYVRPADKGANPQAG